MYDKGVPLWAERTGGYQSSYVHHIENPIRFEKEIKVTIESGYGNHLCNDLPRSFSLTPRCIK
ncbi:MAG: hypothetical protein ABIG61_07040 [Planctomycetota bacterium]